MDVTIIFSNIRHALIEFMKRVQFLFGQIFNVYHTVTCHPAGGNQFIQF